MNGLGDQPAGTKHLCIGLLPVCMAQLLKSVASRSILQPWRAACFHGIWKIRAVCKTQCNKEALNRLHCVSWSTLYSVYASQREIGSTTKPFARRCVCMCLYRVRVRCVGFTWSNQLTPGYLPDWICSSSHGRSLSRPAGCMLQSKLQVSGKMFGVDASPAYTQVSAITEKFSGAQIKSEVTLGHPSSSTAFFQSKTSRLWQSFCPSLLKRLLQLQEILFSSWETLRWSMMEWRVVKVLLQVFFFNAFLLAEIGFTTVDTCSSTFTMHVAFHPGTHESPAGWNAFGDRVVFRVVLHEVNLAAVRQCVFK